MAEKYISQEQFEKLIQTTVEVNIRRRVEKEIRDRHEQDDVMQEIRTAAWCLSTKRRELNSVGNARQRIWGIANNKICDYFRKKKREFVSLEEELAQQASIWLTASNREAVDRILAIVGADGQPLIRSRFFDGKDWKDVARELNISDLAARKRWSRIRQMIRERLASRPTGE